VSRGLGRRGKDGGSKDDQVVELSSRRSRQSSEGADMPEEAIAARKAIEALRSKVRAAFRARLDEEIARGMPRGEVARIAGELLTEQIESDGLDLNLLERRDMVTFLLNDILGTQRGRGGAGRTPGVPAPAGAGQSSAFPQRHVAKPRPRKSTAKGGAGEGAAAAGAGSKCAPAPAGRAAVEAKEGIQGVLMERIDMAAAAQLPRDELEQQINDVVQEILIERKIQLNLSEQLELLALLLDDMLGLGPLEPLLADETITDIMINGPKQVYVERRGKLEITDVVFRDNSHVMNIATRIVSRIGRRVDESSPLVDARLADGSRVNIIVPPLAIDGPSISIRKFAKKSITIDTYERQNNMSPQMGTVLRIAARARLNILISGGTGSGKTTLLNALSQMIDPGERVVTIEDAAELQLQQPHVVRLETRPPNLEGGGEITMRDLVKNALRMRPDRIILGEVRGSEAIDMLQAMNTGHEGSMGTVHANNPREGLTRLENMIGMAGINLSPKAVRTQISDALDMVVQVSRMRDGIRRIVSITEIVGMEGEIVTTQELFAYRYEGEDVEGKLMGHFEGSGLRPYFTPKAEYFGLDQALMEAI